MPAVVKIVPAEQPAPQMPAAEQPAPHMPAAEQPAPQVPAAEQPAPQGPAAEQPAPHMPAAEQPAPHVPAAFLPAVQGAQQNQPLGVRKNDSIIWRNNTDEAHWPWPIDETGAMLTEAEAKEKKVLLSAIDIPAGDVSDPIYQASPVGMTTILYCCRHHPDERGSIVITNT